VALTAEQRRNIAIAKQRSRGDSPRVRQALLEAMRVESSYRNLNYGDRDSVGVLQQRKQYYPNAGKNVAYDIDQFLMRARRADRQIGRGASAGTLAQAVQRSAFPGRYDEHAQEASKLLGSNLGSSPAFRLASSLAGNGGPTGASPGGIPRQAITQYFLAQSNALAQTGKVDPNAMMTLLAERQNVADAGTAANPGTEVGNEFPLAAGNANQKESHAINTARQYLGTWYKWGGSNPGTGFDCSGLLQYSWGKSGVKIPRTTYEQWKTGQAVDKRHLHPGDAVFFENTGQGPGHVGMYIGHGQFIEAPHTGAKVRISNLRGRTDYVGARRYA